MNRHPLAEHVALPDADEITAMLAELGLRRDDIDPIISLIAHAETDHAIVSAVDRIHVPIADSSLGLYCAEDAQRWPCDTHRAMNPARVASDLSRWHAVRESHAVPPCPVCGERARFPRAQGAMLKHLPGCTSPHAVEGRAYSWRDVAKRWLRELT